MTKNNLGKVLITPRGIWSENTEYKRLDIVYALDGSYIAKQDNQGITVSDSSVWQPIAGRGPAGTGNVSVYEAGLKAGKKYLFIPSADNSSEGTFEEYDPSLISQKQVDWNQIQTDQPDFIKNKPSLFSGDYNDLENKPSIPIDISELNNDLSFISSKEIEGNYQSKGQYAHANHNHDAMYQIKGNYQEAGEYASREHNHDLTYQLIEDGKGLSKNDFTDEYKALLSFFLKKNTITSLVNIPFDGQTVYANIGANQSLSVISSTNPIAGQPIHIQVRNTTATAHIITIPTTGNYISMSGASKTLPAAGYLEINIVYDDFLSKYKITVLEAE